MNAYQYINLSYLYEIADGENDFVKEMIGDYLVNVPAQIKELQAAVSENDFKAIAFLSHKLKSSFQFMGVAALSKICSEIELEYCPSNNSAAILKAIAEIEKIVGFVMNELKSELNNS